MWWGQGMYWPISVQRLPFVFPPSAGFPVKVERSPGPQGETDDERELREEQEATRRFLFSFRLPLTLVLC